MKESGPCALIAGVPPSACLFIGPTRLCTRLNATCPLQPPSPPTTPTDTLRPLPLLLPLGCGFIYICEELKSLPKAIWQRGDPSRLAQGKQRRSAGQPRAPLASEKTMVAELLSPFLFHHIACTRANGLFLSPFFFFFFYPPSATRLIDGKVSRTFSLEKNKKQD